MGHIPQQQPESDEGKWWLIPTPKTTALVKQYNYDTVHLLHQEELKPLTTHIDQCVGFPIGTIRLYKSGTHVVLTIRNSYLNKIKDRNQPFEQLRHWIEANGHGIKIYATSQLDINKQTRMHEYVVDIPASFIRTAVDQYQATSDE